jgi:hypothetical protein
MNNDYIQPVPFLADLYAMALELSASRKRRRMPRICFGLGPDQLVSIQPQPGWTEQIPRFRYQLASAPGIRPSHLGMVGWERPQPWEEIIGELIGGQNLIDPRWSVTIWTAKNSSTPSTLYERFVQALKGEFSYAQLRNQKLIAYSCLICGRMLTDPVSMARAIGPECITKLGGTATTVPLWLQELTKDEPVEAADAP